MSKYQDGLLCLSQSLVSIEPPLGEFLGLCEEFCGILREGLHQRSIADLSLEEILELGPVRLLAVEGERILTLFLELRVITVHADMWTCSRTTRQLLRSATPLKETTLPASGSTAIPR